MLLLTKLRGKKGLMRYKVRIKNTEMKIKWERVWNNNRQKENRERKGREGGKEQWVIHAEIASWAVKKSKTVTATKLKKAELLMPPMKTHGHSISFGTIFFRENEI